MSQFRLTAHLGLAFLIFARDVLDRAVAALRRARAHRRRVDGARPRAAGRAVVALLVFLQVLTGGLVAGIRAGFAYNTFPLMNGARGARRRSCRSSPWWKNFFYNMATVQFDHRLLALDRSRSPCRCCGGEVARDCRDAARARASARTCCWRCSRCRSTLGILTLVHVVPLPLAALHQAGALLLFAAALNLAHALR